MENNVKAIRDQGWVPLTSTILQYPVILASKRESEEQVAIGIVSTLSVPSFDYVTNDVDNTSNNVTSNKIVILANDKKNSNTEDGVNNNSSVNYTSITVVDEDNSADKSPKASQASMVATAMRTTLTIVQLHLQI